MLATATVRRHAELRVPAYFGISLGGQEFRQLTHKKQPSVRVTELTNFANKLESATKHGCFSERPWAGFMSNVRGVVDGFRTYVTRANAQAARSARNRGRDTVQDATNPHVHRRLVEVGGPLSQSAAQHYGPLHGEMEKTSCHHRPLMLTSTIMGTGRRSLTGAARRMKRMRFLQGIQAPRGCTMKLYQPAEERPIASHSFVWTAPPDEGGRDCGLELAAIA